MARYYTTVHSPWPVEDAFTYVADLRNLAEWDPGVSKSSISSGSEPDKGTVYKVRASGATLRYRTREYDAPHLTEVEASSMWIQSIDIITVTAGSDGGAVVTYDAELTLRSLLGPANLLVQPFFNRIGDDAARGLARALEGEIVQ